MPSRRKSVAEVEAGDESKLAELGYAQELQRDWSVLHNFGVSFSIISVITGITTLFRYVFKSLRKMGSPSICCSETSANHSRSVADHMMQLWPQHRRSRCDDSGMDMRLILHNVRRHRYG